MKRAYTLVIGAVFIGLLLLIGGTTYLQTRASDFWGFGKLGVSDGSAQSPVFFAEVRGVGHRPTIAYLVRCTDQSSAPKNALDVSHSVENEFDQRTRVAEHFRSDCVLIVGRRVGEKIEIPIDSETAQKWFGSDATIGDFAKCQEFWDEYVAPRLANRNGKNGGAKTE